MEQISQAEHDAATTLAPAAPDSTATAGPAAGPELHPLLAVMVEVDGHPQVPTCVREALHLIIGELPAAIDGRI